MRLDLNAKPFACEGGTANGSLKRGRMLMPVDAVDIQRPANLVYDMYIALRGINTT